MMLESLLEQEFPKRLLRSILTSGRIPGSFLFFGPRAVGKTHAAKVVARYLNCKDRLNFKDDCACVSCSRFNSGDYLDFLDLGPDERGRIPISLVRDMLKFFDYKARERGWKICLIRRADLLSREAADVLLKALEEPSPQSTFILTVENLNALASTIKSRSHLIRFGYLPNKVLDSLSGGQFRPFEVYCMGGSFRAGIAMADLFFLRKGFKVECEDPGFDDVGKDALEAEMRHLIGQLSYASRGNLVTIGQRSFGYVDADKISGTILSLEYGLDLLKIGIRPYLVMKHTEADLQRVLG